MLYTALIGFAAITGAFAQGAQPAPSPTVTAAPGSLPLGADCATSAQCANGADCYASNAMLILRCGNFNAACTNDSQCAFNKCNGGLCNGFLSTTSSSSAISTTAAPTTTTSTTTIPGPSGRPSTTVTAAPSSLPLGASCSDSSQCSLGAQCWASNSGLALACGNFNAACTSDAQCAFNICNNGLCNGFKPSSSIVTGTNIPSSTTIITRTGTNIPSTTTIVTASPTMGNNGTITTGTKPTATPSAFPGAAAGKVSVASGVVVGAVAFAAMML